jgi:hypothetical protein
MIGGMQIVDFMKATLDYIEKLMILPLDFVLFHEPS